MYCVKSVQIRSLFWSVFFCIRTEYRKIRTRENSVFGYFSRSDVSSVHISSLLIYLRMFSCRVQQRWSPIKLITPLKITIQRHQITSFCTTYHNIFKEKPLKYFCKLLGFTQEQNLGLQFDRFYKGDQHHTTKSPKITLNLLLRRHLEKNNFKG